MCLDSLYDPSGIGTVTVKGAMIPANTVLPEHIQPDDPIPSLDAKVPLEPWTHSLMAISSNLVLPLFLAYVSILGLPKHFH